MGADFQRSGNELLSHLIHGVSGHTRWICKICLIFGAIVGGYKGAAQQWPLPPMPPPPELPGGHFVGAQTAIVSEGLTLPCGIAFDRKGDIYVADQGAHAVFKETLSEGTYAQTTVVSGLDLSCGIAVDNSGNVYVSDRGLGQILKETPSGTAYTQSVVASDLSSPNGIAVDSSGNVFIAETGNNRVLRETPSSGTYIQSTVVSGTETPSVVAVDGADAVYVAGISLRSSWEGWVEYVVKETPSGTGYVQSTVTYGLSASQNYLPRGIAVDEDGNVFIAWNGGIQEAKPSGLDDFNLWDIGTYRITAYGIAVDNKGGIYVCDRHDGRVVKLEPSGNFGRVDVGNSSRPISFVFMFDGVPGWPYAMFATPLVVTQGLKGMDFADAGTGSCTTNGPNHFYSQGETCVVDVIFKPVLAGARYGAVDVLGDYAAEPMETGTTRWGTGYVQGIGTGPQVNFLPGRQSTVASTGSNLGQPVGIAVDAAENVYIADSLGHRIIKETPSDGTYSGKDILDVQSPADIAIDGNGKIYILSSDGHVWKETPSASGFGYDEKTEFNPDIAGIAVDGSGNVYLSDHEHSTVLKKTLRVGVGPTEMSRWTESTVPTSGLLHPFGIAVDGSGNVYIADPNNLRVLKETLTENGYFQSTIPTAGLTSGARWIAVDGKGNLYISDSGSKLVLKETPSGDSYIQSVVQTTGLDSPGGIAVDGSGNVYVVDTGNNQVFKLDFSDPPALSFATTTSGTTSADSPQTITLENFGNAPLSFPVPSIGSNPNISSNFSLDSSGALACPLVGAGNLNPGILAAGDSCELSVSFAPALIGDLSGTLSVTDDHLNAPPPAFATQSIALKGSSIGITPTIAWNTPVPITYGETLAAVLNATAERDGQTIPGVFSYTAKRTEGVSTMVTDATLLDAGSYLLVAVFTPTNTAAYASATATVSLTVNRAISIITLIGSPNAAFLSNPVTFTATISSLAGTPTGSVSFYDGSSLLGEATLTSGVATYSTSSLAIGSHSITATYSGENFLSGIMSPLIETIEDFTFEPSGGGVSSQTVTSGGQALYTFVVAPPSGTVLAGPITFKVTGLPAGAAAIFSPSTVALGSRATDVTMIVALSKQSASIRSNRGFYDALGPIAMGILILPLAGLARKSSGRMNKMLCLTFLGLSSIGLAAGIAGCGGGGGGSNSQPQSYALSVTAVSGSLSHTITATLTVK